MPKPPETGRYMTTIPANQNVRPENGKQTQTIPKTGNKPVTVFSAFAKITHQGGQTNEHTRGAPLGVPYPRRGSRA